MTEIELTRERPLDSATNIKRRLAAVAFADVAGFSAQMESNDVETLRAWRELRERIMEPLMVRQGGRVAQMVGDSVLVEFPSAVNAVRWAADVQRSQQSRSNGSGHALQVRIGINVEDVIDDDGVLQGHGVNVASRIHQVARPGQIVVTASVREFVMNRLPVKFHDLGTPKEMKPIPRPPHVFAIEWVESGRVELLTQPYLQWSSRPTVAILPFRTIGGTDDDSYFGEGITDEIITGLSRSRSLFVIARSSTLRYRNRTKNLHQIAAELQVRYLLDGSVQRLGGRLRINAELIDTVTDRPIWTQRYEGATDRLFEFQDQIAGSILASLEPSVQAAEVSHVRDHPTESLDAYHCLLRGLYRLYFLTEESHREAGELFERAISLDPSYARAHAHLAWWLNFSIGEGWSQDPDKDRARAMNVSQHAVTLDGADPFVLTVAGHTLAYLQKRLNEALELFDKALALDQNSAFAWGLSALTLAYLGRADEALERLENLWRLNPFDPLIFFYWTVAGVAEFVAGRYNEAISWLRKSRRANPQFRPCLRTLAASLALSDDAKETQEEARAVAKALLEIEPSFSVSKFVAWYPLRPPDDLARLATGLRTAGLPD